MFFFLFFFFFFKSDSIPHLLSYRQKRVALLLLSYLFLVLLVITDTGTLVRKLLLSPKLKH